MKANRKFLNNDEDAVSPVIAVILMVAITVVLAATVYVWVSGFSGSGGSAAKTIALTSDGSVSANGYKNYTIASASPGLKWEDLKFTLNGADLDQLDTAGACPTVPDSTTEVAACSNGATEVKSATVDAGDAVKLYVGSSANGKTLRVLDSEANAVILTLTIG